MRNLFCDHRDLRNEADVEQNFARRLIEVLGYPDKDIRPKAALEELVVGRLDNARLHRPDFAMKSKGHIRWILEAKAPSENLDRHVEQARGYCEAINSSYSTGRPVEWFVLTKGMETRIYGVGDPQPLIVMGFEDFTEHDWNYQRLLNLLRPTAFGGVAPVPESQNTIHFTKPSIAEVNHVFAKCHQHIHQSDHISQAAGFVEFVKLITLKLLSDKKVKEDYPGLSAERQFDHPASEVTFSLRWVNTHEASTPNPVDSILFKDFMDDVEVQIAMRVRKRFFDEGEQINLKAETIKGVVERLESLYLFGIDADLNGRLFENFLSATMRGKDLGQYFTPRTLVKMGVGLSNLKTTDFVLDGCCGTGGFLIDALADMWAKVNSNASLSSIEKQNQRKAIADNQIYGIDFAKDPNLAKIARLNMYLHGDGGSRIFNVDALDLTIDTDGSTDTPEEAVEKEEMRSLGLMGRFDVVLTNPPFSKKYERSTAGDATVLDQYSVASGKASLLAKLMFFEMYHHYLKPGGRLVSVIDDGFLNGNSYRWFRNMLRRLYIVKAVVSLPGDAFQRSEARVKTSFIVLEKRRTEDSALIVEDPSVFMYACRFIGIDDPKRRRWMPGDDEIRVKAREEVEYVVREYERFLQGNGSPEHIVPPERVRDRLDVKHCLIEQNWRGADTATLLSDVVAPKEFNESDTIECVSHEEPVQLFTVKYDGTPLPGRVILPRTETEYQQLYRVREGEIVISNIAATYGSVAIVPAEMDGLVVSKEYTVLTTKVGYDARVVWAVLRSPEIRAEMLVRTTGANRTRIRWSDIQGIAFPYPDDETTDIIMQHMEAAEAAQTRALAEKRAAIAELNEALSLDHDRARHILDAFKPPR